MGRMSGTLWNPGYPHTCHVMYRKTLATKNSETCANGVPQERHIHTCTGIPSGRAMGS